jgi:hypothetical protein
MLMKKDNRLQKAARWIGRVLDVRLPMGTIFGIRTK